MRHIKYMAESPEAQQLLAEAIQRVEASALAPGVAVEGVSLIYSGRNQLYRVATSGGDLVVKSFQRPSWWRALYYSFLGSTKAQRSHMHALELARRGIGVAETIGCGEERRALGILGRSYYVSRVVDSTEAHIHPHARGWAAPEGFMPALASFLAELHERGVAHEDLSPGNILYRYSPESGYSFYLVDLNRMKLYDRPLTLQESIRNMDRLMSAAAVTRQLATYYAACRRLDAVVVETMLTDATDHFWAARLPKLAQRYAQRVYGLGAVAFLFNCLCYRSALFWGNTQRAGQLYRRYLQPEDIRHVERHRHSLSYQYAD